MKKVQFKTLENLFLRNNFLSALSAAIDHGLVKFGFCEISMIYIAVAWGSLALVFLHLAPPPIPCPLCWFSINVIWDVCGLSSADTVQFRYVADYLALPASPCKSTPRLSSQLFVFFMAISQRLSKNACYAFFANHKPRNKFNFSSSHL